MVLSLQIVKDGLQEMAFQVAISSCARAHCRPLRFATEIRHRTGAVGGCVLGACGRSEGIDYLVIQSGGFLLRAAAGTVLCTVRRNKTFHHSGGMIKKSAKSETC